MLLSEGKVAAVGPVAEVMHRLDLFPLTGRAEAGAVVEAVVERHDERFGLTELRSRAGPVEAAAARLRRSARALRLRVRARDVMLAKSAPTDVSALNVLPGVVADIGAGDGADRRHPARLQRRSPGRAIDALLGRAAGPRPGTPVHALIKSVALDRRSLSGPIAHAPGADAEADEA